MRILHLLDASAPEDALDMLALLTMRPSSISTLAATHRILALGPATLPKVAARAGIPAKNVHAARSLGWADPAAWRAIRQAVGDFAPTHLHAWSLPAALAASTCQRFAGARLLTLADVPARGAMRWWRLATRRAAWGLTAHSASIEQAVREAGIRAARMEIIRPGIRASAGEAAARGELRKLLGIRPADGPVLLIGGPPTRAARYDHAMWAAAIFSEVNPKVRVVYRAGKRHGMMNESLRVMHHPELAIQAPDDLPLASLLQAADVLLVAADGAIATGTLLQAMAAGVPIVATAIGPIRELIEDRETGLLAPPGKPRELTKRVMEVAGDAALTARLTENARAVVDAEFQADAMVRAFAALYERMGEARGAHRGEPAIL